MQRNHLKLRCLLGEAFGHIFFGFTFVDFNNLCNVSSFAHYVNKRTNVNMAIFDMLLWYGWFTTSYTFVPLFVFGRSFFGRYILTAFVKVEVHSIYIIKLCWHQIMWLSRSNSPKNKTITHSNTHFQNRFSIGGKAEERSRFLSSIFYEI